MSEQFDLMEEVGRGPSSVVHEAWDNGLKRKVAVKALTSEAAANPQIVKQFWTEASCLAARQSERLISVYAVDHARRWMVLELAAGSVAQMIAAGPSSVAVVRSVLGQALEGLIELHSAGLVHGQLKPTNLLTFTTGRVKLSDPAGISGDDAIPYPYGGEKYLAPELIDPEKWSDPSAGVDPRLDLYTLGFIALEMLAGPKFDERFSGMTAGGADQAKLWTRYHGGGDDPRALAKTLVPSSAASLLTALTMMLAKPVHERAASAKAVRDALGKDAIPPTLRAGAESPSTPSAKIQVEHLHSGSALLGPSITATTQAPFPLPAPPVARQPVAVPTAVASDQPSKPFLEDTRKTAMAAAAILFIGLLVALAVNLPGDAVESEVSIVSSPEGATVVVGGTATEFKTPRVLKFAPGKYKVQVAWKKGELSKEQTLVVPEAEDDPKKKTPALKLVFKRAASANAETTLEGTPVSPEATSPATPKPAPASTHDVAARPTAPTPKPASAPVDDSPKTTEPTPRFDIPNSMPKSAQGANPHGEQRGGNDSPLPASTSQSLTSSKANMPKPAPNTWALTGTVQPPSATVVVDGNELELQDGAWGTSIDDKTELVLLEARAPGYFPFRLALGRSEVREGAGVSIRLLPTVGEQAGEEREFPLWPLKLVWCPPGSFAMGSPDSEDGREDDERRHRVTLTKGFWMSKFEVPQGLYEHVMKSNPSWFSAEGSGSNEVEGLETENLPVEQVSCEEANEFCARLSKTFNIPYRLPTEAEWEYACRAGSSTAFHWGERFDGPHANVKGVLDRTAQIGSYPPNAWGLCDMHANVFEWCSDWYDDVYYDDSPNRDPTGPNSGVRRICRGGSWALSQSDARSANRYAFEPSFRSRYVGFRVVIAFPDEE